MTRWKKMESCAARRDPDHRLVRRSRDHRVVALGPIDEAL
jgi:hypothetical protein